MGFFGEQCSGDRGEGIIVRTKYCRSSGCEGSYLSGSCTKVPITKDLIHAVKHAHSECAIFLENQHKQALLEEEEKKKKEQAEEAKRVEQRTSKRLHVQLARYGADG